ncbi:MAG TPA: BTAD domain-containing putative transcriptional regulator, partial [Anaerolineaceae bacterium]
MALEARLFGQYQIRINGSTVEIPSRPAQSLLAYLLTHQGIAHRREKLAGLLWPDASDENARRSLRQALWHVRRALKDAPHRLLTDDITVTLNLDQEDQVDALRLEETGTTGSAALAESVALYAGELLPGFYEEWVVLERERLQAVFERKINQLIESLTAEKCWEEVIPWAERWISTGSAPEAAFRALMTAHHGLGNLPAVAVTYQRAISVLDRELGLAPSSQTRAAYQQLLTSEPVPVSAPEPPPCHPTAGDSTGVPPFKGLHCFEEDDTGIFFGRESLTAHLLEHLDGLTGGTKLLAVVGPSGSGKSSLVRAGLIPAVKARSSRGAGRPKPAGQAWEVRLLVPTSRPLESLAFTLTAESDPVTAVAALLDDLTRDSRSLHLYLRKHRLASGQPHPSWNTLLVVDQFEEVFTQCRDENERRAFIENLISAAAGDGTWVVLVLRADFYSHCAQYAALREALAAHQEYIGRMTSPELRRAITEPAAARGWDFEPGLVDLILHDIGAGTEEAGLQGSAVEPGALPLLSHALLETWNRRQGCSLTLSGYTASGGVRGAIARTAENTYAQLSPVQQGISRAV